MTVTAFAYDGERGTLEELHYLSTLPEGASGERLSTAETLVDPSGRFLYVSNRGHNSIAIFAIYQETGRISVVGHEPTQGQTPRNFAIDPRALSCTPRTRTATPSSSFAWTPRLAA